VQKSGANVRSWHFGTLPASSYIVAKAPLMVEAGWRVLRHVSTESLSKALDRRGLSEGAVWV